MEFLFNLMAIEYSFNLSTEYAVILGALERVKGPGRVTVFPVGVNGYDIYFTGYNCHDEYGYSRSATFSFDGEGKLARMRY